MIPSPLKIRRKPHKALLHYWWCLKHWFSLKKVQIDLIYYSFFSTDLRLGYAPAGLLQSHPKSTTALPRAHRAQRGWSRFLTGVPRTDTDAFTLWKEFQKPEQGRQRMRGLLLSAHHFELTNNTQEQPARHPRDSWTRETAALGNSDALSTGCTHCKSPSIGKHQGKQWEPVRTFTPPSPNYY